MAKTTKRRRQSGRRRKNPDRGMFYCRGKCAVCEDRRRLRAWFPGLDDTAKLKGWVCWKCATEAASKS